MPKKGHSSASRESGQRGVMDQDRDENESLPAVVEREPGAQALVGQKEVHPDLARAAQQYIQMLCPGQYVLRLVDRQDLQLQELLVSETIRSPLHRLDLVV